MKPIVVVAFIAAVVATGCTGPVTLAINWTAVSTKVSEIEQIIFTAAENVKAVATNDDAVVGRVISQKVDIAGQKSYILFEQVRTSIRSATLTEAEARDILGKQLKDRLTALQADLTADLNQLSGSAAIEIRNILEDTYTSTEARAQQLYLLLRQ